MCTQAAKQGITAIVVDDNEAHRDLLCRALEAGGDRVTIEAFSDADKALANLPPNGPVVVICDYLLSGASGIDWLPDFVRADVGPVIIVTSSGDEATAAEAFRQGAADYIVKSAVFEDPERLRRAICEALRRFKLEHTNRDLSRRLKLANAELQRKNEVLADLTETAHRFVDDVAHEFRTPLTVIKEFASIMTDGIGGDVSDKQIQYLHFISNASGDLSHLIDDFLDSGKIRSRALRVDRREHSVRDLIDATWPLLESRAAANRVELVREIPDDLPTVFADADKARRSLVNLVVNAIKFSDKGSAVTVHATTNALGEIEIGVTDQGPGLSEDARRGLFERFHQGSESRRSGSKGFGLGLSIVKELVAVNLGTVAVDSEEGRGSTFAFTLVPYDIERIIDAFVQRTSEQSPDAVVAVLSARRNPPVDSYDDLQSFVASVCHSMDVQLPGPDGRSSILIGQTIEPDAWQRRLLAADERVRTDDSEVETGQLQVEQLGSWPIDAVRDAVLELARGSNIVCSG